MNTYLWLKLVHVVAAIVAVGTNLTYFVWIRRSRGDSDHRAYVLNQIKFLDSSVALPAYIILPVTGVLMVFDADLGFGSTWIAVSIGLYVAVVVIATAFFSPALRRESSLAGSGDLTTPAYARSSRRTTLTGVLTMVPVAAILYLMVMKP